ncbi:DNA polymerase III subunit tau [Planctomycetes bacterium Pan216]|uniref:DNA polymerase III subunit gamma/tau n=1 Tax=Kolteria novifilia TaxID=2527975 RepID=A0A518B4Z8_9BACT|nr:DNA polymerase III subunit tau [Planctomycetes bacterium Pan216]
MASVDESDDATAGAASAAYTVLARRYRPQQFEECIGQEHVAHSLRNAIETGRVAHAYLFTGARGVGKTSMARIFAKALNCQQGPTTHPCGVCDICVSVAGGDDVDVIEIDGASNRGIEEVRELRQGVNYRPSRSRYKVYIIDEVHMLTREAFNALLKTLEEPPGHAKFLFATTEPQKIPITILSRCQRFDFSGIELGRIVDRLKAITESEGFSAEPEALEAIARRAGGSMRDSQSLLDQLLAFASGSLGVDDVHRVLGSAGEERVIALASAIFEGRTADALTQVTEAAETGIQLGEWAEQMLAYFRDLMAVSIAPDVQLVSMPNRMRPTMTEQATGASVEKILEMMDLVATCRARMKASTHERILWEMTIVRLCRLDHFLNLGTMMTSAPPMVSSAPSSAPKAKKKVDPGEPAAMSQPVVAPAPSAGAPPMARGQTPPPVGASKSPPQETPAVPSMELTPENVDQFWKVASGQLKDIVAVTALSNANRLELREPELIVFHFPGQFAASKKNCEDPARLARIETACSAVAGKSVRVRVELGAEDPNNTRIAKPGVYGKLRELAAKDPLVVRAQEILDAQLKSVESIRPASAERPSD